jgi:hypothetical protein
VVEGLTNGTGHTFTVVASNIAGSGAASSASGSVTPRTVPGAPTGVTGVAGDGQVTVSWTAPAVDGGSAVTGYVVTGAPAGSCTAVAPTTTCVVSGLTNGTGHTFTVVASNVAGAGAASAASGSVVPFTDPDAPSGVQALAGNAEVEVSWVPPVNDGGLAVAGYEVVASPGGATCSVVVPVVGCTVTGLVNGSSYSFVVTAVTTGGSRSSSDASELVVPFTVPDAPTGVEALPGDGRVTVSWVAPVFGGGRPITGYRVTVSPGGQSCVTGVGLQACEVDGLTNGDAYALEVVALNEAGPSVAAVDGSGVAEPVVPFTTPDAPTAVVVGVGDSMLAVSWSAPGFDGGRPVVGYRAVAIPSGKSCETTSTSCDITELTNLRAVSVVVTAVNESGESLGSASSGPHTPVAPPAPEPFGDVPAGTELDTATRWLRGNEVTTGKGGGNSFAPTDLVTRAQMAGFLYRLAGEPDSVASSCGFLDEAAIPATFRQATCWAKDRGITTRNTFDPQAPVNRGQMAAFLYRLAGEPDSGASCGFSDENLIREEFREAACWLKSNNITVINPYNGAGLVARGSMALFLYRFAMPTIPPS